MHQAGIYGRCAIIALSAMSEQLNLRPTFILTESPFLALGPK